MLILSDRCGKDYLSAVGMDKLSLSANYGDETDTSGFASCSTSTYTHASDYTTSPHNSPDSHEVRELKATVYRRSSSGQKLAKFINALTPCRGRMARRSQSFGSVYSQKWQAGGCDQQSLVSKYQVFRVVEDLNPRQNINPMEPAEQVGYQKPACSTASSCAVQLDVSITDPTVEVHEFRRLFPSSFLALITNYLGFLIFTPEDMEQIQDALTKESKTTQPPESSPANLTSSVPTFGRSFTPQKSVRSREAKCADKELEHWYIVVNTILNYLLEEKRYKHRFIVRRPGNQSSVNELEKTLFPPRHRPLSLSVRSRSTDQTDEKLHSPAMVPEILSILERYDATVVACVLARVLRRHGVGLIPVYLRRLFLQLVTGAKENAVHQRRAIRLLFQLVPKRLLRMVIRPVFELLASIANEPACEVDETSLAVLFSPILFLDRSTTTPASLANPLPARVVELLVRTARLDLQTHQSLDRTFQVPVLFQDDCVRNLTQHLALENPPLSCSLKYCVSMSPRSRDKHTTQRDSNADPSGTQKTVRPIMPKVNLTSNFMAKRPRHVPPFVSGGYATPVLKNHPISPILDFRVRRTPTTFSRAQYLHSLKSPLPSRIETSIK
ncbi:hypothetical protein CRM22_007324 [Opisthorchis felineus]|uniref:Rho-GAP domain-containing protein n=2 Tax=Opisthorchis felineus TaxID=147828 RepID=A0A4S2LGH6_OPIFE|nr:hypothetical protein CRM22_007324 [Opisthorchis felineus]